MPLPSFDTIQTLLSSGEILRKRILAIARRLEELNEYSSEQALRIAADIVRSKIPNQTLQGELQ